MFIFLKRRPGMSVEEFRTYYEERHSVLCEKYMGGVTRYVRHYVQPLPNPATSLPSELDFDVVTEVRFKDHDTFDKAVKFTAQGILPDEVIEDEKRLFDRSRTRFTTVTDRVHVFQGAK
jgi:hypothetical protein